MNTNETNTLSRLTRSLRRRFRRTPEKRFQDGLHVHLDEPWDATPSRVIKATQFESISGKLRSGEPIVHSEWAFLLHHARLAYIQTLRYQDSYKSAPLVAVLSAFRELLKLRNEANPDACFPTDSHYLSRLLSALDSSEYHERYSPDRHDPIALVSRLIDELDGAYTTRRSGWLLVELLQYALDEESLVSDSDLNLALAPFRVAIFRLAARGLSLSEDPHVSWPIAASNMYVVFNDWDYTPTGQPLLFQQSGVSLAVVPAYHNTHSVLHLESGRVRIALDTINIERWIDIFLHGVVSNEIIPVGDSYVVNSGAFQITLDNPTVQSISEILLKYLECEDLASQRSDMLDAWGQI